MHSKRAGLQQIGLHDALKVAVKYAVRPATQKPR